jgi:hypothetical protein
VPGAAALTDNTVELVKSNSLAAERQPHDLQLREKHVQVGQLGLARAGQVARGNVDDPMRVAEVRDAHVFTIETCA